jgi:indolepyruvate ferredoxin oxidoreductase beta subunit
MDLRKLLDTTNILLCGLGGQGILFMTRVLAQAAVDKGFNVLGGETHGMAQRGGSVISHLRLGEVRGSLVQTGTAHILLALEENEGYRNLPFLAKKGKMFVNTNSRHFPREEVRNFLDKRAVIYRSVPAATIAQELGAPRSSNLALLGYFSAFVVGPVGYEELKATIDKMSPKKLKDINMKIFQAGYTRGKD